MPRPPCCGSSGPTMRSRSTGTFRQSGPTRAADDLGGHRSLRCRQRAPSCHHGIRSKSRCSAPRRQPPLPLAIWRAPISATATVCGCGDQGRVELAALLHILPLRQIHAWDSNPAKARQFADELAPQLDLKIEPAGDLSAATLASDVIVTCTTARTPFLGRAGVRPGTFIAAVGADSHDKSELEPELMAQAIVVADVLADVSSWATSITPSAPAPCGRKTSMPTRRSVAGTKRGRSEPARLRSSIPPARRLRTSHRRFAYTNGQLRRASDCGAPSAREADTAGASVASSARRQAQHRYARY